MTKSISDIKQAAVAMANAIVSKDEIHFDDRLRDMIVALQGDPNFTYSVPKPSPERVLLYLITLLAAALPDPEAKGVKR